MLLDGLRRDYTRFDERQQVDLDNPWLGWGQHLAYRLGEARGWSGGVRAGVARALIIVLSGHADGDVVFYSAMSCALRALELSCERTAEVLDQMGILIDDRRPSFEDWLDGKLDGIAPGIAGEVETWLRRLRDGGPRARPRNIATVWKYANALPPILLQWSTTYDHLREVGCKDVLTALQPRHGAHRQHPLIALRSLFGFSKKNGVVFRNPTSRIPVPDLAVRPWAHCLHCGRDVESMQTWKRVDRPAWGRYRAQYVYRCSTSGCHQLVEPYALPAEAIDWSVAGQRIGDRTTPLRPATIARIEAGLARYARVPQLVPGRATANHRERPMTTGHAFSSADCRWSLDTGQRGRARDRRDAWTAALAAVVQTWPEGPPRTRECHRRGIRSVVGSRAGRAQSLWRPASPPLDSSSRTSSLTMAPPLTSHDTPDCPRPKTSASHRQELSE